jgi:hypothetical protein
MKAFALLVVLATAVSANLGAVETCLASADYNLTTIPSGVIGCNGYGNSVNISWTVSSPTGVLLTIVRFDTEAQYDYITIVGPLGQRFGPYSGATIPGPQFFMSPGTTVVRFITDASNTRPGFTINYAPSPNVFNLNSGQPYSVQQLQQGGFVYFALPYTSIGKSFYLDVEVTSYSGLKEPATFVAINNLPTLEAFIFTNNTVQTAPGQYSSIISVNAPTAGRYFTGVFLYGTAAKLTVTATWRYNIPFLQSGVNVQSSIAATPTYYQLQAPIGASTLTFQVSRQVPGGYPIVYIGQGYVANSDSWQFVMDTSQSSYISLPISNPNPLNNQSPNPGNYIVTVASKDNTNAGFILQAAWM